jgi:hypothetical protein
MHGTNVKKKKLLFPFIYPIHIHRYHLTSTASTFPLEWFGDFKMGRQATRTAKYTDELVLLAKEETILHSMIDILIDTGRCYGVQKQLTNVEYFSYLPSRITNDARCKRKIKFRNALAHAAFNKKNFLTIKLDLNFREEGRNQ